jgi:hypothetical protein
MFTSPQDDPASQALTPSQGGASPVSSPDISKAASVTLLIHGVGDASYDSLLKAAAQGYEASEFGRGFERCHLAGCPVLWGPDNAAECLVLYASGRSHILIALPWARRRIRLPFIAKASALLLLQLMALAIVTFALRHVLEFIVEWLRATSHWILAYFGMMGFAGLTHLFSSDPAKEFKPPPMRTFCLVPLLLVGVMFFVEGTWLWVLMVLPLGILGLISMLVILRCIRIAPTIGWRLALVGLISAIALVDTAMIGISRKAELRSESRLAWALDDRFNNPLSNPVIYKRLWEPPSSSRMRDLPDDLLALSTVAHPLAELPSNVAPNLMAHESMWSSPDPAWPAGGLAELLRHVKWSDLVTWSDLTKEVIVTAEFVLLCFLLSRYGKFLDFGLDVLHYTGKERLRTSLIDGVAKAIRWIDEQAPNAPMIVVGHSLGSVLAAQAVASMTRDERCLKHTVLVTMGSPLNYLSRVFPSSVQTAERLSQTICERMRWINFWRRRDLIGKKLNIAHTKIIQRCVGTGGHPDYWSDRKVWRAVAREGLGAPIAQEEEGSGGSEFCIFERGLGTLVGLAILGLIALGAGLWAIAL